MKNSYIDIESYGVESLSYHQKNETNGGIIGFIAGAFMLGMVYGYAMEKIETDQW
ncbi:hypothetical protein ACSTS3_18555 [Aquimarina muelleri]|uniref:hypothetical protein n=1 Tax=Aquimarina muelleri TaxID=279356 RepID=UPI003F684851